MANIVFFDFDGTITVSDSLVDFIQYYLGKKTYYLGLLKLSPILVAYKAKIIPNYIAKEKMISYYFKGRGAGHFKKIAEKFSLECIDKVTNPKAMERIRSHQRQGDKVVIVSASIECWLDAWCKKNNFDLIATRLEIKGDKLTGKFATKNCYGIEKVNRIKKVYDLREYDYVYAYGDSRGDKELLALAHESFYNLF